MSRCPQAAACAIASLIVSTSSALAAETQQLDPAMPWLVVPIAAGLVAVAWALIAMHRLRRRLRMEQQRAAEALRASEHRYRTIVEDQSELICRWRPDGLHSYANPAYCRSFGMSADEMLRTRVLDLIPEADHAQALRHWETLTPSQPAGTHRHRVLAEGGKVRLQEWTDRAIFDAAGNVIEYQSVGRDITDHQRAHDQLRESELRFRTLSESAPIGIFRADQNGWTSFVNEHLLSISGLSAEEAHGHGWMKIIHPDDIEAVRADLEAARHDRAAISREFRIITTWKDERWVRLKTVWIAGAEGTPTEQVGTVEDITDQKRVIELARIHRELSNALGTTSHLGEALDYVLDALFKVGGFDAGAVHLVDGDTGDVHMLHSKGLSQTYIGEMFHQPAESPLARMIERGAAANDDAGTSVLPQELRDREQLASTAIVPIAFKDRTIGVLLLGSRKALRIPESDLAVFEMIAAKIGGAISRIRALSELRAERDHSTRIIQGTPAIVCGIAPDGTTLFVNPAGERITGYAATEIVGKNWWTTFYPGEEQGQVDRLVEALREGDVRDFEMRLTTRDGGKRIISWNSINRLDDNGELVEIIGFGNDVTARRLAEDELRKFKAIADRIPHGQAIVDMHGNLLYVNAAWAQMHGYEPHELVGRHLSIFHSQDQMPRVTELNEGLVHNDGFAAQEVWHIRRDGTPFPTLMDAIVIKDETGHPLYLSGMASDITEIKRAEEALTRAYLKMTLAADAAGFGIWELDLATSRLEWDDWMFRLYGVSREDFAGTYEAWHQGVHPEDRGRADEEVQNALRGETEYDTEFRIVRPDGETRHLKAYGAVTRDAHGTPQRMTGINYDITQRKKIEASLLRQALVLNSINDAVYLTDAENRITYWNVAAEDVFGYGSDDAMGKSPSFLYHPDEIESLDDCIRTGLIEDGFWADEVRFRTKGGDEIVCEMSCSPVRDEKGDWVGTVAIHRDITARKQSEEERERLRNQLNQSQKLEAVGTLSCGIAHDFNNLLSAIFGHTHLAKSSLEPGHPALRSLNMVTQTAQQARGVISALMTFSRRSIALKKRMDVVESVHDAVRLLRRPLPGSIEITEQLPADPLWVNGDDAQLKQVWMNLAVNARDAMPSGGLLAIEVSRIDDPSVIPGRRPDADKAHAAAVRIRVKDTGRGMSPEILSRVYEPFFTTKPRSEGTGLGMSVVHAIVEDHGGWLQIESTEGGGSTVDVFLPVRAAPQFAESPLPTQPLRARDGEAILLLEDDAHIRSILTSSLRSLGFEVFAAADPLMGVGLFARHLADIRLLILNLDVPDLDRSAFLDEIRGLAASLPILLITADKRWRPPSGLRESERILRMPYQIEELLSMINEMVDSTQPSRTT